MKYRFSCVLSICFFMYYCTMDSKTTAAKEALSDQIQPIGLYEEQNEIFQFTYSGSGFACTFHGNDITIGYESSSDENYIMVELNQKLHHFELQKGRSKIILKDSTDGLNTLRVFKQTEARNGIFSLMYLDGEQIRPLQPSENKIVWIGNSITCGYGNGIAIPAPPEGNPSTVYHPKNQLNYYAYSSMVSRNFNAEAVQICQSGKGIYRNYDGTSEDLIPTFFNNITSDTNQLVANLYVILAGTNDFAGENGLKSLVDSTAFVEQYLSLLSDIEVHHEEKPLLILSSNMLSNQVFTLPKDRLNQYLKAAMNAYKGSMQLHFFDLPYMEAPYGENWHPSKKEHERMAELVSQFIELEELL